MKFECAMESVKENKIVTIILLDDNNKGYYASFGIDNIDSLPLHLEASLNSIISKRELDNKC